VRASSRRNGEIAVLWVLAGTAFVAGCAEAAPPPAAAPSEVALTSPDDSDLWNLAPGGAESIVDVDVIALGRSPWSRALVTGGLAEDRDRRLREFGYDVFTEVDRVLVAGLGTESLTVVRGRFDTQRVTAALAASTPDLHATRWRDSPMWEGSGRALALVTPRTLTEGTPPAVRGAIDAAWGVVPDARAGPLGQVRRALGADRPGGGPAVTVAVSVTDDVRARAAGFVEVPPGLGRVGARLDLGRDLDLDARAFLADARAAGAAADVWRAALRDLARQRVLRLLGLGPVFDGASLVTEGTDVHGHVHIGGEQRQALSDRLLLILQTIAKQGRPGQAGGASSGARGGPGQP
jgi:hypothetical protein